MDSLLGVLIALCPFIPVGIGVLIGWWFLSGKPAADARALQNKFAGLGTLKGKTLAEIEAVVGQSKSRTSAGDQILYSWDAGNYKYSITLVFKGDVCDGVLTEHVS